MLACRLSLKLSVESLVYNTVATVLTARLGLLPVAISFMQLLSEELKELVCILLLSRHQVLECLLLTYPESRQNVGSCIAIGVFKCVEVLEHIVHGAAQAMRHGAVVGLMAIAEVVVPEKRIVQKALQNDVLVAGSPGVVYSTKTVCSA